MTAHADLIPSTACDAISFNGKGQLFLLTYVG